MTPVILAFSRWRQGDQGFKARLSFMSLGKQNKTKKERKEKEKNNEGAENYIGGGF